MGGETAKAVSIFIWICLTPSANWLMVLAQIFNLNLHYDSQYSCLKNMEEWTMHHGVIQQNKMIFKLLQQF